MSPLELAWAVAATATMAIPLAYMIGRLHESRVQADPEAVVVNGKKEAIREAVRHCPCTARGERIEVHPECRIHHQREWRDRR